jgi:hypothetical protein
MADAYRPSWLDAPSLNERQREGVQGPILKGKSRLEAKVEAKPLVKVTDAQFRKIVRERDKQRCRRCGRKTVVTLENVPLRCEVHHVHGRLGVLRHEDRCALCLCNSCHEKVTGKVNERWAIVGTKFIEIDGQQRIDASAKVTFTRIA